LCVCTMFGYNVEVCKMTLIPHHITRMALNTSTLLQCVNTTLLQCIRDMVIKFCAFLILVLGGGE